MHATPEVSVRATAYSGWQSDSLVATVMAQWARLGHPEYQRVIDSWRREHLGTTNTAALRDAPPPDSRATAPSTLLAEGDGTVKSPPQLFGHREALHFGNSYGTPTVLEGEMTFAGDLGKISVGSFSITTKSGGAYSIGGDLANGPGQLSCVDISICTSKRLAGSLQPSGIPYCDASASGNIIYTAQNLTSSGTSISPYPAVGGVGVDVATLSQQVNATADACPTTTDPGSSPPSGGWADPAPDPNPPVPPPEDPIYPSVPKDNYCYSYSATGMLYVIVVCTAN
jgi:hypothetical protein